eukprot:scaffold1140_cov157-Amphora_coffeaeformis.AAC.3
MPLPRLYLGTMTFGWSQTSSKVDESIAAAMVDRFMEHEAAAHNGPVRVDTARIYAGGKTEKIVGSIVQKKKDTDSLDRILIGTKAHPSQAGGLSASGIQGQWKESMQAMKLDDDATAIEEYYLHQPDTEHALEESLRYVNEELVQKGLVKVIGMSNYHASEVERAFAICAKHNWQAPTVYQGLYNPLNRAVEQELLPLLRKHKCSFVAYNPLAAGLLTGKHTTIDDVQKGRFKNNPNYLPRFYTEANFQAIALVRKACDDAGGIPMVEATYRWLLRHSALQSDVDGVLLGASSLQQLDQNLAACAAAAADPLPDNVLQAFEEAWKITSAAGVFPYWRSYSSDMPGRESLDQGASYEASKK